MMQRNEYLWGRGIILLISILFTGILMFSCNSGPKITFEKLGSQGGFVFLALISPSNVSDEDLANKLKQDWQNNLYNGNMRAVLVYDNSDFIRYWMSLDPVTISDEELKKEQPNINQHWLATYWKNKTSGLHQVEFMSRDSQGTIVKTIYFNQ